MRWFRWTFALAVLGVLIAAAVIFAALGNQLNAVRAENVSLQTQVDTLTAENTALKSAGQAAQQELGELRRGVARIRASGMPVANAPNGAEVEGQGVVEAQVGRDLFRVRLQLMNTQPVTVRIPLPPAPAQPAGQAAPPATTAGTPPTPPPVRTGDVIRFTGTAKDGIIELAPGTGFQKLR